MARPPQALFRFTSRHLVLACVLVALVGAGVYRLYSPSEHVQISPSASPLPVITVNPPGSAAGKSSGPLDSPLDELAAAQREKDPDRRAAQIRSALQAWARIAPDAAAKWVLAQPPQQRLVHASVVLIALADRADDAVRITRVFCQQDPLYVREHGNSLVAVLTTAGEFERAVNFASLGGPERGEWITRTFSAWSELAPAEAARAALALEGDDAVSVVFTTWAARHASIAQRYTTGTTDLAAAERAAVLALARDGSGG